METKTKKKSFLRKVKWKRIIVIAITLSTVLVGSVAVYFAWNIYKETDDFTAEKLLSGGSTRIFDDSGNEIYTLGSDENGKRVNVEYEDLPQVLVDAVVAGEDSRYFEHDGFDLPRIAKAFISNLTAGRITGGGSTITQQVIKKSYFPDEEKTYTRKFSEIFLAMEATKEVSKEEILTMYLNKIYFGRSLSSIGVSAASKYYFNKEVSELTLPEAALLAGTLNSPSSYDPFYNLEAATSRRNVILNLMVDHGYITQEECDDAKAVPVENLLTQESANTSTAFQAYIDLVINEVKDKTGLDPVQTPMDIHTFLNTDIQTYIEELANSGFDFPDEFMQVGASIQSVNDGRIVGVVGGRNYADFGTNRSDIKRQPGSSLKPITAYGAAFEYLHWSTAHTVEDKVYNKGGYNPTNYDGTAGTHGQMNIANALYNSWNTSAVWTFDSVVEEVGYETILNLYEDLGVDVSADRDVGIGISYTLGGWQEGTTPIEMSSIYATVANGGKTYESHTINYIDFIDSDDDSIMIDETIQAEAKQSLSAEATYMIRDVQAEQVTLGTSYSSYFNFGQIRAKTGTTK
ncbi:MAG: transglycosylase domain-containing protein [Coprobacillaceae bacterium]